jgi:hypothetical protein
VALHVLMSQAELELWKSLADRRRLEVDDVVHAAALSGLTYQLTQAGDEIGTHVAAVCEGELIARLGVEDIALGRSVPACRQHARNSKMEAAPVGRPLMDRQQEPVPDGMPINHAWLITGIPGAGKTTLSPLLAARFSRGVYIPGDHFHMWIMSGRVLPGHAPAAEAQRQMNLSVGIQTLLARAYAEAGFVPVLDYVVVTRERLDR